MVSLAIRVLPLLERELAELFGISDRHVRRIRREARARERARRRERVVGLANSRAAAGYLSGDSG